MRFFSLFLFLAVFTIHLKAQTELPQVDYISRKYVGYEATDFIFKNTRVFYHYTPSDKKVENDYKQKEDLVKELFELIEAAGFDKMTSLNEKKLNLKKKGREYYEFPVLEYRKGDKKYRICWDTTAKDEQSQKLNEIKAKMNSFW